VELELHPVADAPVLAAVRRAVAEAGLEVAPVRGDDGSAWQRAARLEAAGGDPVTSAAQARSPRSTRGATRA
jgi:hypothetical protein